MRSYCDLKDVVCRHICTFKPVCMKFPCEQLFRVKMGNISRDQLVIFGFGYFKLCSFKYLWWTQGVRILDKMGLVLFSPEDFPSLRSWKSPLGRKESLSCELLRSDYSLNEEIMLGNVYSLGGVGNRVRFHHHGYTWFLSLLWYLSSHLPLSCVIFC
jgi:hypothetical protein